MKPKAGLGKVNTALVLLTFGVLGGRVGHLMTLTGDLLVGSPGQRERPVSLFLCVVVHSL